MLKHCIVKVKIKFIRYDQSSQCNGMEDSSVSYACAVAKVDPSGEDEKKEWATVIASSLASSACFHVWPNYVIKDYRSTRVLLIAVQRFYKTGD